MNDEIQLSYDNFQVKFVTFIFFIKKYIYLSKKKIVIFYYMQYFCLGYKKNHIEHNKKNIF